MPRPYTLQDIIKSLQAQLDQLANPLPGGATVLDATVVADEDFATADANAVVARSSLGVWAPDPLTLSGNEITDALRKLGVQGDGRAAPAGVGIWEASTNLCTNGGFETDTTGWTINEQVAIAGTLAVSSTRAKFGTKSGLLTKSTDGTHYTFAAVASMAITGGATYTISAWVYLPVETKIEIILRPNAGTTYDPLLITGITPGVWTRISRTRTFNVAATTLGYDIGWEAADVPAGAQVWIDGVQVEQKAFATPYIHTDGATASRAGARVQAPASLLNATQGWVAMRVRMGWASASQPSTYNGLWGWGQDGNNEFQLFFQGGNLRIERYAAAAGTGVSQALSFSAGDYVTAIFAWTGTQIKVSGNGTAFLAGANTNIPTITALQEIVGDQLSFNSAVKGLDSDVLWFACGTGTLTDADAATLNALGNTIPDWGTLPPSAAPTMIWPAVDATTKGSGWGTTIFS